MESRIAPSAAALGRRAKIFYPGRRSAVPLRLYAWGSARPVPPSDHTRPGDRVLVTGASGFLGAAVADVLRSRGYRIRTLVRATSPRANLDARDEAVVGDILDAASLGRALQEVDHVVHAAADYRL